MSTFWIPDNNSNWVDHIFPTVASLANGQVIAGWTDFRSDVANDTHYDFRSGYLSATAGSGTLSVAESSAWPSAGAATYSSTEWYGDVNVFAHGALHAHLAEEFRTTGFVAPQVRIESPQTTR